MTDPTDFGAGLRRQRERRGVSLAHIARETKISSGLLADLERGDLSRWPAGIFGRAFIRSYAEAVGLEPREVLTEFLQLVPAGESLPPSSSPGPDEEPLLRGWTFNGSQTGVRPAAPGGAALRLTFADHGAGARLPVPRWVRRLAANATDGAMLLAGATIGRLLVGPSGWLPGLAVAAVALVILASTVLETTPGQRLFKHTHRRAVRRPGHGRDWPLPLLVDRRDSSAPAAGRPQLPTTWLREPASPQHHADGSDRLRLH